MAASRPFTHHVDSIDPLPLVVIIKVAPHIATCPWGGKNHPKLRTTRLDKQATQIIGASAASFRMLELRGTAVSGSGKNRSYRWSVTYNLVLLTTSEGQPYSVSLKVGNLMLGEDEHLPRTITQQVSIRVPSSTMVCPSRKILPGGRNSLRILDGQPIKQKS